MNKKTKSILVAASMSAGKSSLINALIGKDLLPSGNEATTAKIARITVCEKAKPSMKAYCHSGIVIASFNTICTKQIQAWNISDEIASFDITIPYSGIKQHSTLAGYTLVDTPGANNSRDERHKEQFINALKAYPKSPVLYVLNATQLGTTDDAEIIRTIRAVNPRQPVIFALNKVDALDEQRGETVKHYVALASKYLAGLGYKNAKIIPLMAQSALIAKKSLDDVELRRTERYILNAEFERFREHPFHLNSAAKVPQVLKKNVRRRLVKVSKGQVPLMSKKELYAFIDYTGLSTVNTLMMGAANTDCVKQHISNNRALAIHHISIIYNPYLVETKFLINGQPPSESSIIAPYRCKRLQLWVKSFFDDLQVWFNGKEYFFIEFTGVETDFDDIKQAADKAIKKGMNVELNFNPTTFDVSSSKNNIQNFEVVVVGSISCGKSTFINAMLGQDLLPTSTGATTPTITRIFDDKSQGGNFYGECFDSNSKLIERSEAVDLATMKAWSNHSETKIINLKGDIRAITENSNLRFILTDTPELYSSASEHHRTLDFIQDSARYPLIIYVLNATQLGTNDDTQLLRLVADTMSKGEKQSKDRFLFVVNKMDMFDPEWGENIEEALSSVKAYLNEHGIYDPNIYPISAYMAYLLRKKSELSRKERSSCSLIADLLLEEPSMALHQYMSLSPAIMSTMQEKAQYDEALQDKTMWRALLNSGLPGVEAVIHEYMNTVS
ncbi:dynamin family protein [Alishewanella sp. d11]|uniref:dynamin family protein n=1 Tax=Alishewanella sp. d11 TaxID=3414030 RepID=UPI003BF7FC3A